MKLIKERDEEGEKGGILGRMEKWSEKGSRERKREKEKIMHNSSRATLDEIRWTKNSPTFSREDWIKQFEI